MKKLSAAALLVALALFSAIPFHAQGGLSGSGTQPETMPFEVKTPPSPTPTVIDFTFKNSQCYGGVWPINCGVTVSDGSTEQVFGMKLVGMDVKAFCLGIFGCPSVDSVQFNTFTTPPGGYSGEATPFHFPTSITFAFHQANVALGPDGVYDDSYSGYITFNMSYNCHSSGGGRGSHNVVCTAQVIGIEDASITWVD